MAEKSRYRGGGGGAVGSVLWRNDRARAGGRAASHLAGSERVWGGNTGVIKKKLCEKTTHRSTLGKKRSKSLDRTMGCWRMRDRLQKKKKKKKKLERGSRKLLFWSYKNGSNRSIHSLINRPMIRAG